MEPFLGLQALLAHEECDWPDIERYVVLARDPAFEMRASRGLGQRLGKEASYVGFTPAHSAWLVACEIARAYNGMLAQGAHTMDLALDDLPMKHLTECTVLRPDSLPHVVVGQTGWRAEVLQGRYPTLMLENASRIHNRRVRTRVTIRMHRFVCWLARGPPEHHDLEVCHSCSNTSCVRPSHLRWDTHKNNMQEKASRKRRR